MEFIIIPCPHCFEEIIIYIHEINCGIFRHGVYKHNLEGIDPHASKEECDKLVEKNQIIGCGKPFRIILDDEDKYKVAICDYI